MCINTVKAVIFVLRISVFVLLRSFIANQKMTSNNEKRANITCNTPKNNLKYEQSSEGNTPSMEGE